MTYKIVALAIILLLLVTDYAMFVGWQVEQMNKPKKCIENGKEQTMSRYIKFDDAVKVMACEMYAEAQSQGFDVDSIEDFMPEAKAWLNDAPSIDIVRCAECKHWERLNYEASKEGWCDDETPYSDGRWVDADDFCSYGEREGE